MLSCRYIWINRKLSCTLNFSFGKQQADKMTRLPSVLHLLDIGHVIVLRDGSMYTLNAGIAKRPTFLSETDH